MPPNGKVDTHRFRGIAHDRGGSRAPTCDDGSRAARRAPGPRARRRGVRLRLAGAERAVGAVLRGGGAVDGDQLARLRVRGLRPRGHGHAGQAAGRVLAAGAVRARVRGEHVGDGRATGRRRRARRAGALPGRAPPRRAGRGPDRGGRAGGEPGGRRARPRQHLRFADDLPGPVGRGRGMRRPGRRPVVAAGPRGDLGGAGVPGEDARSVARVARAGRHLPGRGPRRARAACGAGAGRRRGERRRVAVVDDRRQPRARGVAAVRRRQQRRLALRAGVRLQRARPGR